MSKLTRVLIALTVGFAAVAIPLLGVAIAAVYIVMTSVSLFGIMLISGATLLAFKNVFIAIGVIFVGTVILAFNKAKKTAATVDVAGTTTVQ